MDWAFRMRARGVGAFVTALCLLTASTSVLAAAHPAPSGGEESAAAEAHDVPEAEEAAPAEEPKAARLSVSGLGWLENLQMKGLLRQLRPEGEEEPATYDANAIEDGAFLLLNRAQSMGYLQAEVSMEVTTEDGGVVSRVWREGEMESLPRPLTATEVRYVVAPGKRYFHERLVFRGLTAIDQETARGFFVRANGLLQTRALLRFSEREFEQAAAALETELQSRGYADAKVTAGDVDIDHETGAVRAEVVVEEGRMHRLGILRVVARESADGAVIEESTRDLEGALSRLRLEDIEQEILEPWFHEGYPDAEVELTTAERGINPQGERVVDVSATVIRGPRVKLGTPRFTGDGARFVGEGMRQRLGITGPWLDRIEVDEARARLPRPTTAHTPH
jgi:outer membrane protein assembly factor BamA